MQRKLMSKVFLVPGYISPDHYLSEWFKVNSIFVTGLDAYDTMIKLNYSRKKLEISGHPKYDFLKTIKSDDSKNIIEKQFHIDTKKTIDCTCNVTMVA